MCHILYLYNMCPGDGAADGTRVPAGGGTRDPAVSATWR